MVDDLTRSRPNMSLDLRNLEERAAALVAAATKAGADGADAVVAASESRSVDVREGALEESQSADGAAFQLRVFCDRRVASISANQTADVERLAERAVAMARAAPVDPHARLAERGDLAHEVSDLDLWDETEVDQERLFALARETEDAALSVDGITASSGASASAVHAASVLATSTGFAKGYLSSRYALSVSVLASHEGRMERDYASRMKRHFPDLPEPSTIGLEAGERAARRVSPRTVPSQHVPVLFEPRVARSLIGHFTSAINGMSVARKTSFLRQAMGEAVFGRGVTIIDDPLVPRMGGSRPFDGEGVRGEALELAREGVLQTWLLDGATARELDLKTNGRAGRAGSGTAPGITNVSLLPGQRSPEEMMADIGTGLAVTEVIGQGVNLVSGDYSRGVSGFWIEGGEITHPVSEITIAGNLRDMFRALEPASDVEHFYSGSSPSILIEGMTLAGR